MLSVKGRYQEGVVTPAEPVAPGLDGREVIITFLDAPGLSVPGGVNGSEGSIPERPGQASQDRPGAIDASYDPENDPFLQLIDRCQVSTGIGDLAHQHDHYLYGTPKKPPADE